MSHKEGTVRQLFLWFVVLLPSSLQGQTLESRIAGLEARLASLESRANLDRQIVDLYERVRDGVIRVQSGLQQGTGFFVRTSEGDYRFIVTNDHVIAGGQPVSVAVDSTIRVPAQILATDVGADLAVLRIHDSVCQECATLSLGEVADLAPGQRVIAIGFPLNQEKTVTSGVVSSMRNDAVMTDLNLNPGNSGGPLLTLQGLVVGVNTFVDQGVVGPGISGSVAVGMLEQLIDRAIRVADTISTPPIDSLPVVQGTFPPEQLREISDSDAPLGVYGDFIGIEDSQTRFLVTVLTPVAHVALMKEVELRVGRERRERERRAGLSERSRYRAMPEYRNWIEYVGSATRPYVSVQITPKFEETVGSMVRGALVQAVEGGPTTAMYRFRGDVLGATIFRNDQLVEPFLGGTRPIRYDLRIDRLLDMRDVAYEGLYFIDPEHFLPDVSGLAPEIKVVIQDLKNPQDTSIVVLPAEVTAQIWNDFLPFHQRKYVNRRLPVAVASMPLDQGVRINVRESQSSVGVQTRLLFAELGLIIVRHSGAPRGETFFVRWSDMDRSIRVSINRRSSRRTDVYVLTDDVDPMAENAARRIVASIRERFSAN